MTDHATIAYLKVVKKGMASEFLNAGQKREADMNEQAFEKAIHALEAQMKLKECIANLDNPEFKHLTWTHEEVLKLLKEHVA